MAELKTQPTSASVKAFLDAIPDDRKRADCKSLAKMMTRLTGEKPRMWGDSIVGFGSYHYKYESGREGDWFLTGFSPRARNVTAYIMAGFSRYGTLMKQLGKHKTGKSCLYFNTLDDLDLGVLEELITESSQHLKKGSQ